MGECTSQGLLRGSCLQSVVEHCMGQRSRVMLAMVAGCTVDRRDHATANGSLWKPPTLRLRVRARVYVCVRVIVQDRITKSIRYHFQWKKSRFLLVAQRKAGEQ